jgi:hypothetical protein
MGSPLQGRHGPRKLGIGIAFRKKVLQDVGGFKDEIQVFEYLELYQRLKGIKGIKTSEMTVLHLEPENRFELGGYLRRRVEYGSWYNYLFRLYPRKLSIFAFPVKLFFLSAMLAGAAVSHSYLPILALLCVYLFWLVDHFQLLHRDNVVKYAMSNFARAHQKLFAFAAAIFVINAGEIAGEVGKLWGMLRSPIRKGTPSH